MTGFSREKPLAAVRWVRVGSINEPKLAAVRSAIGAYAPDAKIEGVAVASGVPEQPVGFEEVIRGARNRAAGAANRHATDGVHPESELCDANQHIVDATAYERRLRSSSCLQ